VSLTFVVSKFSPANAVNIIGSGPPGRQLDAAAELNCVHGDDTNGAPLNGWRLMQGALRGNGTGAPGGRCLAAAFMICCTRGAPASGGVGRATSNVVRKLGVWSKLGIIWDIRGGREVGVALPRDFWGLDTPCIDAGNELRPIKVQ